MTSQKKIIGITIGDPAGIGPEVVVKAIKSKELRKIFTPLLIGPREIWNRYGVSKMGITVVDVPIPTKESNIEVGYPNGLSGEIAYKALQIGVKLALSKVINALVTAPVSKQSFYLAGYEMKGHTEILAEQSKTKNAAMLMVVNKIFALLATRHLALRSVAANLHAGDIIKQTVLCADFIESRILKRKVKIAISCLNPHCGESGLAGDEEKNVIIPVVNELKKRRYNCSGPVQSDIIYAEAVRGKYDLVVNMYHDQAMIPLKLINPEILVNSTVGLPFLRTSPGHGVAFDIVNKNIANPSSMIEAIGFAARYAF